MKYCNNNNCYHDFSSMGDIVDEFRYCPYCGRLLSKTSLKNGYNRSLFKDKESYSLRDIRYLDFNTFQRLNLDTFAVMLNKNKYRITVSYGDIWFGSADFYRMYFVHDTMPFKDVNDEVKNCVYSVRFENLADIVKAVDGLYEGGFNNFKFTSDIVNEIMIKCNKVIDTAKVNFIFSAI